MRHVVRAALVSVALMIAAAQVAAQSYFGQNQVQYDRFNWRVKETEHFLIHYYPEEAVAAADAARMAERAYGKLSRIIGYQFRDLNRLWPAAGSRRAWYPTGRSMCWSSTW